MSAVTTVAAMKKLVVISDKSNAALMHSAGEVTHRNGSQSGVIYASLAVQIQTYEEKLWWKYCRKFYLHIVYKVKEHRRENFLILL